MQLDDLARRDGPFWAAWQAHREREDITGGPDHVPSWFLAKTARARVAAARVELEKVAWPKDDYAESVFEALRVVEQFILTVNTLEPTAAMVVAGLLGAQEIETEREFKEAGR